MYNLAQPVITDEQGRLFIEHDWHPGPLPENIELDEMSYPDTAYSFTTFFSKRPVGLKLGYASGNYGHSSFTTGVYGQITVGKFVVLQGIRMICNHSITIGDHCMFSWGCVITDSWFTDDKVFSREQRRAMLEETAKSYNRHLEFTDPKPIIIEENVWVGFGAIILPGVTIGRGAVIGCNTIVSENIPPYAVAVGAPVRIIKYLEANDTDEVKRAALEEFAPIPTRKRNSD